MAQPQSINLCSVPECSRPVAGRGLCLMHYKRWRTHGDALHGDAPLRCQQCGATFRRLFAQGHAPGYCSDACRRAFKLVSDQELHPRIGGYDRTCPECGATFQAHQRNRRLFCSRTCKQRQDARRRARRQCRTCGQEFITPIRRGTTYRLYCSAKCRPKRSAGHGYVAIYVPDHPLANKDGWQYEHRVVMFDALGPGPQPCHWCGRELLWTQHYNAPSGLGVDHMDWDRANNDVANLVPSCRKCNGLRKRKQASRKTAREDGGFGNPRR